MTWRELKFRWRNCYAPLPGEMDNDIIITYPSGQPPDIEPIRILRKFRGLLGYGPGWRFHRALFEFLLLPVIVLIYLIIAPLIWYFAFIGY